ncbi:LuxR C-terminal-related transcriptional regulator [Streptomyces sp. NPDC050509]|uniref:LuxR C-terminal-related transcriptional regulator n=1 Tax=Streptomyces sp. NPDC050509 TaxID=3365620 RepID=UPI00378C0773
MAREVGYNEVWCDAASGASSTLFRRGTEGWCVALAVGPWLRLRDYRHRVATESARQDERLALARELHDVVAHHITGIVLQTQGARIIGRKHPEKLDETLEGIETAGTDALAATLRVVIVTTFDLDEYVYGTLHAGAVGFVLKDAGPALLVEAVRAASSGDALISPSITLRLLRRLAPAEPPATADPAQPLSGRELEVVRAIGRGRTNQEIGAQLFISVSTVKSHLATIQTKLGMRNRVEVAAWAWESRLMDSPEPHP